MDLTFQVLIQYCFLKHQSLLPSPDISKTIHCFRFGSASSLLLELVMLITFSCAQWPSGCFCLFWTIFYLFMTIQVRSSAHFQLDYWVFCFFWLMSCMSFLCTLETKPLSVTSFSKIFSQPIGCHSILFMVSFAVQKLVSLFSPICFLLLLFFF